MIRMDRYTEARWRAIPSEIREQVEARVPDGYDLHLTHGGKQFSAYLFRQDDGQQVMRNTGTRPASTALGLLHRWDTRDLSVTTDAEGYVTSLDGAA